ncbi:MAG: periplasmic heavy metal sensor [Candidatus Omnitrophota bacterium]|nr:periplasmic heavy metal sensor [Candidatus Omnitrophota bacterium]MBU1929049.1 periplasmic heavy metal sensor [Candidatus Omnitrophota bacterium]MBU2034390.1 periplasmic heavy metal sensor [Candidatus Omnitrophota bacterium]MBU2221706.1 periplasmic heavy metal sensor [Candidatus Omnitrophota bacterium]
MMDKIKMVIISLVVFFVMAGVVYAQPKGERRKEGDVPKASILKELNLTTEQNTLLEANREAQREESIRMHSAMKEKMAKLQEELKNSAVTRAAIEPLANEIKGLQSQLIEHRVNGIFAVKEILTPEQFVKFQQLIEEHKEAKDGRSQQRREKNEGISWRQQKQN